MASVNAGRELFLLPNKGLFDLRFLSIILIYFIVC